MSPEWLLQNPVTSGTMMGGGMNQNTRNWSAGVNASESGGGYNIQVRHGTMVVTVFTYGPTGEPMSNLGVAALKNSAGGMTTTGTLDKYFGGQCASCTNRPPSAGANDGTSTITFSLPDSCVLRLPAGRTAPMSPMSW